MNWDEMVLGLVAGVTLAIMLDLRQRSEKWLRRTRMRSSLRRAVERELARESGQRERSAVLAG
jgi:hypothetical protein